jgi:hypothetical protein
MTKSWILFLTAVSVCAQGNLTIGFNINHATACPVDGDVKCFATTDPKNRSYSVKVQSTSGPNAVLLVTDNTNSAPITATVTISAPTTTFTGTEVQGSALAFFVPDTPPGAPATGMLFKSSFTKSIGNTHVDTTFDTYFDARLNFSETSCPGTACEEFAMPITTAAQRHEPPGGPRLMVLTGLIDFEGQNYSFVIYYDYNVCPGGFTAGPSGCADSISLVSQSVFPAPGDILLANDQKAFPPFFAIAKSTLNSKPAGKVVLQVRDGQSGNPLQEGPPVLTTPGDQLLGGTCVGPDHTGNCLFSPIGSYSDQTSSVNLVAVLKDSNGNRLVESNPITYPIIVPNINLTLGSQPINGSFTPAPASVALEGGSQIEYSVDFATIQAQYDYPGISARLTIEVSTAGAVLGRTLPQTITKGTGQLYFQDLASIKVPTSGSSLIFTGILETSALQTYRLPPIRVPIETVSLGPAPATPPAGSTITLTPTPSGVSTLPVNFAVPVTYQIGPAGAILNASVATGVVKNQLSPGSGSMTVSYFETYSLEKSFLPDLYFSIDTTRPDGTCPCAHGGQINWKTALAVPAGSSGRFRIQSGLIDFGANTTTQNTTTSSSPNDLNPKPAAPGNAAHVQPRNALRPADAGNSTIPDFFGVHRTWTFTPPIPPDGTFSASLTLAYSAADLPDDPNFDESKLQIVSYNPSTGTFTTYPTALDMTNKAATAQVSSLEPMYSLAVPGPFTQTMLNAPYYSVAGAFRSTASVVNTGTTDAHWTLNGFSLDGTPLSGSPVSTTLPAANQLVSSADSLGFSTAAAGTTGWMQAGADSTSLRGLMLVGDGTVLDAVPLATVHSSASVLTDIESDDTYSTELRIVNPATNRHNFAIDLRGPDGASVGTYSDSLNPKDTFVRRVDALFPSIQKPFTGYALVSGDGDTIALELVQSFATLSSQLGHPLNAPATGPVTFYGPQLGVAGEFTRVILVNAGPADANLTFTAHKADGTAAGNPVTSKLAAGAQSVSDLSQLFGFNSASPLSGSFSITSDQASVIGDLVFGDSSLQPRSRTSIPLLSPATASILPLIRNDATAAMSISIANVNNAPASVAATIFDSTGKQIGQGTVTLAANASSVAALTSLVPGATKVSSGYLTLGATQPVASFGVIALVTGSDFAALPAQPIASAPTGPPIVPQISLSPSSFDFGSVSVGQQKTQAFTITNAGKADLHVSTVKLSGDASFSLTASFPATTVSPGKSTSVTAVFKPTAATAVAGALNITSDDPANGTLTAALKGTGAGAGATSNISASPASLDFGSVMVQQTSAAKTVTVANSGSSAVIVNFVTSAPFAVSPASATIAANGTGTATVTFKPTSTGSSASTLNIAINGQTNPVATVALSGAGTAPTSSTQTVTLSVDGGSFNQLSGFPDGAATAYFVNRLTPPSYPVTLRTVQIAFLTGPDSLKQGAPLTVVVGANPTGSATINNISLAQTPAAVGTLDTFNTYNVSPITITSGDFVVGFNTNNPPNVFPMALDTATPSKQRSYVSTDGVTFGLLDSFGQSGGNFGIRATVDLQSTTSGGTVPRIAVSPSGLDFGSVAQGQIKDLQLTISNTGGGTLTVSSLSVSSTFALNFFTLIGAQQTPFNVPSGGQQITVRFFAGTSTSQSGTLTIVSNDTTVKIPLKAN